VAARLWNAESGREIAVLRGHTDWVHGVSFSPDGSRLVTASGDNTARIWDAETGSEIAVLRGHTDSVESAVFSSDGRRVATASIDCTARVWGVYRTEVMMKQRALVLAAAIAGGVGRRTASEQEDLLMQDAPEDIFAEVILKLGDRAAEIANVVAGLGTSSHPNCYLSPSQFAEKVERAAECGNDASATRSEDATAEDFTAETSNAAVEEVLGVSSLSQSYSSQMRRGLLVGILALLLLAGFSIAALDFPEIVPRISSLMRH
jgi:hypothetical protein